MTFQMGDLERGVVINKSSARSNRHLAAAELFDGVSLRLRAKRQRHEPDVQDLNEHHESLVEIRNTPGFGTTTRLPGDKPVACLVACPGCEDVDEEEDCDLCGGSGLVTVADWDQWAEEELGCLRAAPACERTCTSKTCPYDEMRIPVDLPILVLDSQKDSGAWSARGNSLTGFKLNGLCKRPSALHRFLSIVATGAGFGLFDE